MIAKVVAFSLLLATVPLHAQNVVVEFTSQVFEMTGTPVPGVSVGSTITGRVVVDLATLPGGPGHYFYSSELGGHPGMTIELQAGGQEIRFDSAFAPNDPGITPGLFLTDEAGGHDWITFQFREVGRTYGTVSSFEMYQEPRTFLTGPYFPESVNFQAGMEKASLDYFDNTGANSLMATVLSASMVIEGVEGATALLALRLNNSALPAHRKEMLLRELQSVDAALANNQCAAALRSLQTFQNKVRAQVEKSDPDLAARLIYGAQAIIHAGCPSN